MSIKTVLFFSFWLLLYHCIITPISGIIDYYYIMEIKKKQQKNPRKNETKLKTIHPKNYEYFKNSKFRVQFYWPYFFVIIIYLFFYSFLFLNVNIHYRSL